MLRILACCVALLVCSLAQAEGEGTNNAPREPDIDALGNIQQKIVHRMNADGVSHLVAPPWSKGSFVTNQPTAGSTAATSTISYHGGPVMPTISAVYLIWYGNWNQANGSDTPQGQQIIRDALFGLSQGNAYSPITTGAIGTYSSSSGVSVTQISSAAQSEIADNYSQGRSLSDSGVLRVLKNAIAKGLGAVNGQPTAHSDAVYLVLSSTDVAETSGFCSRYCGWHTYTTTFGSTTPVKYAFVGNANRCLSACAAQVISPNGNAGVDAMVSVIAHEMEEAATDPLLNAWYDSRGSENADKCAWTFGSSQVQLPSGAYYNVTLPASSTPARNYLVQRALGQSTSKCYVNSSGGQ